MSTDYGAPALAHPEVTPALHIPCLSAPLYTNIPSLSSSQDSTKMTAFPILTWRTTIWIFRLCEGCKGSTGVHQERAISGVPIPETMKSDDNLYGRRKKRIRINSTRTDSLKLQTIILCWWFHSCYYLTETFAELCFLHTFPVRSSTPQMGPFRSYICMYTIHPQAGNWRIWKAKFPGFILSFTKRTRPAAAAALGYDLWLLPRSLCLHSVVAVTVHIPPFVMALY